MNKYSKLFGDSWKDTFNNKIFRFLFPTSSLAGFFGTPLLLKNLGFLEEQIQWWFYVLIIIIIFLVFYIVSLFYNLWLLLHNLYVDSIFFEIIEIRKDMSVLFNDFINKNNSDVSYQRSFLTSYCDKIKSCFDKLLNADINVSIKVIVPEPNRPSGNHDAKVCNLCRDSKSVTRDTEKYMNANHTLFGNTTFSTIVNSVSRNKTSKFYYLNNDILADDNYQNTSIDLHIQNGLPYRSELVVPIFINRQGENVDFGILGFVCLDCAKENIFKKHIDCEINLLKSIAADFYTIINLINEEE